MVSDISRQQRRTYSVAATRGLTATGANGPLASLASSDASQPLNRGTSSVPVIGRLTGPRSRNIERVDEVIGERNRNFRTRTRLSENVNPLGHLEGGKRPLAAGFSRAVGSRPTAPPVMSPGGGELTEAGTALAAGLGSPGRSSRCPPGAGSAIETSSPFPPRSRHP